MTPEELAQKYAPVLRLHRDEFYRVDPVELTLSIARFDLGNTHTLRTAPQAADLYQSPEAESRLDLPGDTVEELRSLYPAPEEAPDPVAYYTVTTLGTRSVEANPPEAHVAVQYYLHFFADEWGYNMAGGHRHEGDWEVLQILFNADLQPYRVTATQQWQLARDGGAAGGAGKVWSGVEVMNDTHPVLYVGGGGHSLYFEPGATRYATGPEWHDGLGEWLIPANETDYLATTDYPKVRPLRLSLMGRLGETAAPGWLRYAGLWGQADFPQAASDLPTPSTRSGPVGPAFMGTTTGPASASGVYSVWTDPYAFAMRTGLEPPEMTTHIRGALPSNMGGLSIVFADARGRVYRVRTGYLTGEFEIIVPVQNYILSVVETDEFGRETLVAAGRFSGNPLVTALFPTQRGDWTMLSNMQRDGNFIVGSPIYLLTDADGDGIYDAQDEDQDNDGIPNQTDPDALGDGWLDAYQVQDPDGDGISNYYDDDDDNDGIPDAQDEDANGNGIPDVQEPVDTDHDGFIDAVDLDWDNDGFTNVEELAAGTDPRFFFDRPGRRAADVDDDGHIDTVDAQSVIDMALRLAAYNPRVDFDQDGAIDAADVQRVINMVNEAR